MTDQVNEAVAWTDDAEKWGHALNEAAWTFIETCPEKSALLFNSAKGALRAAILRYAEFVAAVNPALTHPARGVVDGDTFEAISAEMREVVNGYDFDRDHDLSEWAKRIDALAAQPAVPSMSEAAKWAKKVRDFSWRLDAHEQDIADELVAFLESFVATPKNQPAQGVDGA